MASNITIYSKDECPRCTDIINLLQAYNLDHTIKKLGVHFDREWLLNAFVGVKMYPVIVIDGRWVQDYQWAIRMIQDMHNG